MSKLIIVSIGYGYIYLTEKVPPPLLNKIIKQTTNIIIVTIKDR
tara:strand:- start:1672 stop:1803 length:132 start_codon:yes stop_codon:yes gene_type:complete